MVELENVWVCDENSKNKGDETIILVVTGFMDFVHYSELWILENNFSDTGSIFVLR
jgi:hypothetical protein